MVKFIARFYIKSGCEEDYLRELRPCVEATRKSRGVLNTWFSECRDQCGYSNGNIQRQ